MPPSHSLNWRGGFWEVKTSGRGTTRAEDAQGTPNQSYISPSVLVHEGDGGVESNPTIESPHLRSLPHRPRNLPHLSFLMIPLSSDNIESISSWLGSLGSGTCRRPFRRQFKRIPGLLPESQYQNLALTVLYMPDLLDSVSHPRLEQEPFYDEVKRCLPVIFTDSKTQPFHEPSPSPWQ
jgi:hypothetical protein